MGKVRKTLCVMLVVILCLEGWFDINVRALDADASETIIVSLMKMWDDYGNIYEKRPKSIEVTLLADGEEVVTTKLTEETHGIYDDYDICFAWYYKCDSVPEFNESGEKIKYTWLCEEIDGYTRYVEETDNMTIVTDYQGLDDELDEEPVILKKVDENGKRLDNCLLGVTSGNNEILRWTSGDAESIEITKEGVTADFNKYGDIVIYGLDNDVEYTYEEFKPADGYTSADSIDFKLSTKERTFSFNWYTSIEKAAFDASNLTTENADCYIPDAEAGVFINGDVATIILLKDTYDTQTFQLSADVILDLNDKTLNMTNGGTVQYNSNLAIEDGNINFNNESNGIDGNVSSDYSSKDRLLLYNVKINSNSSISNAKTINANESDVEIVNSEVKSDNSLGGYNIYLTGADSNLKIFNSAFEISTSNSRTQLINLYSSAKYTCIENSIINTIGAAYTFGVKSFQGNLSLSDNEMYSNGFADAYNVQALSSVVNIDSGKFFSEGKGKGSSHNVVSEIKSYMSISGGEYHTECDATTGNSIGISVASSDATIYNVEVNAIGRGDNTALKTSGTSNVNIYGGYYYARPVDSANGANDSYGAGLHIENKAKVLVEEREGNILISGGNAGIINVYGSNLIINSGTFCSPNHGGIYCASGSAGSSKINGGLFYNNYNEYEKGSLGEIHPFGAAYFGCNSSLSTAWSVDVRDATFLGGMATYGVVQKSNDKYIPATINLYNCYISGSVNDILIQPNESVDKFNAYINIYDGTILKYNNINDQYEKIYGESHIVDYRVN